jgi:hypothetical protein
MNSAEKKSGMASGASKMSSLVMDHEDKELPRYNGFY